MWRDRTNLYISYRQSYAHHPATRTPKYYGGLATSSSAAAGGDDDRRGLLSADPFYDQADDLGGSPGDAVIEMDVLPPRWADISDEVAEILGDVARQSQLLDRLHQKHVLPGFNEDEAAKRAEENEIERLTQTITRAFHDCHGCIQRVDQMVRESKSQGTLSRADETMAKNVQISLAARVQEASANFRKKQSAYLKSECERGSLEGATATLVYWRLTFAELKGFSGADRASTPVGGASTSGSNYAADPSLLESDADRSFSQWALQQSTTQQKQAQSNDAVIMQREREIEDIAQGIIDLSDLFRDLQNMVIDQGTMLDRIDYNVENMNTDVKAAEKELVVASGYQKKTTKRKIILLLILIVAGMIILLIIKPKRHGGGGGGGSGGGGEGRGGAGEAASPASPDVPPLL
ncbi:syntaxin 16 [Sporothrix schenckii 1099-18]|uniref:Syntaxin 16 n=1 Tax=Sporothrix schenckii 1099-18 TaxID=1397361 RepID=A0A0F2LU27_SPOSC|nr:syntaxin 16 [Sporothrix schenckii 1099-18]KJR80369.1 syntaxin 16 [Sporothrix schenckii 1099-18]